MQNPLVAALFFTTILLVIILFSNVSISFISLVFCLSWACSLYYLYLQRLSSDFGIFFRVLVGTFPFLLFIFPVLHRFIVIFEPPPIGVHLGLSLILLGAITFFSMQKKRPFILFSFPIVYSVEMIFGVGLAVPLTSILLLCYGVIQYLIGLKTRTPWAIMNRLKGFLSLCWVLALNLLLATDIFSLQAGFFFLVGGMVALGVFYFFIDWMIVS